MSFRKNLIIIFIFLGLSNNCDFIEAQLTLPKIPNSSKLPPCKLCKVFVESFQKGIDRTARGKHDGGDAAWEEEKLRSYKTSEIRLVEIQDSLCKDLGKSEDQCHSLAEEVEPLIEEWWFNHQTEYPDLHSWLCIEKTKVCCPAYRFGPNCQPCMNCNGNGICKGNGTRMGNGKCKCDEGYRGEACESCDLNYFESFRDESKFLCTICHTACSDGGCTSAGPKGCRVCKNGWKMESDNGGCVDINECVQNPKSCHFNQFCVNSEGSFKCLECDKSCDSCIGDGPDLCVKCAEGYDLKDGICTDMTNEKRDQYVNFTRYLTYFGLCVATCVIFQSSTWIASVVGLAVALYISVSEYWLKTEPTSNGINSFPIEIND